MIWWKNVQETKGWRSVVADDAGNYLRATASYTDAEGSGKSAQAATANAVAA